MTPSQQNVHLITEVCEGGELFRRLLVRRFYTEREAACVLRSLISAIHFMHHKGIMHGDLKPENIFLRRTSSDISVRLGDFGHVRRISKGMRFSHSYYHTFSYVQAWVWTHLTWVLPILTWFCCYFRRLICIIRRRGVMNVMCCDVSRHIFLL